MARRSGDIPEYRRISGEIRQQIKDGRLHPGQRLPSEKDYGDHYGVSRGTVRRALEVLENEALIVVKHPQGRFVRQDRERSPLRVGPDDDVVSRMPTDLEVVAYDMEGATPLLVVTRADGTVEHYSADQHSIRGR